MSYYKEQINIQQNFYNINVYTGQTERQFQVRYTEHVLVYKNNYSNSAYAQHLINYEYSLGHMEDITDVIFATHKGRHLDTTEKYHICWETAKGIQINDKSTITKTKYLMYYNMTLNRGNSNRY